MILLLILLGCSAPACHDTSRIQHFSDTFEVGCYSSAEMTTQEIANVGMFIECHCPRTDLDTET